MTDHLLASLGLLDPRNRASLTREDVAAEMVPLLRAIAAGVVQPFSVGEWAALSEITRGAIDDVLMMETPPPRGVEGGAVDGDSDEAAFAVLQMGLDDLHHSGEVSHG